MQPRSYGTYDKGTLTVPLRRGGAIIPETFLPQLPSNCTAEMTLTISWDEEENWVKYHLTGTHVLNPNPSVQRTEGVNFFPNPFWPEEQNFTNGRYMLWTISPSQMITFYYDPTTLDLMGSQYEFPTPPAGAIPVTIPGIKLFSTPFFEPDSEGNVDLEYSFEYAHAVRGDDPIYGHHYYTTPATNLCLANPYRYDLTTSRGYLSEPVPASEALPFSEYLRNGLLFDMTVEPPHYYTDPPLITQTSTYSNWTATGGGSPPGWSFDLDAVFMNNAPPIKPFALAGTCADGYSGTHIKNINFCESQP